MHPDIPKFAISEDTLVQRVRQHAEYVRDCLADGKHEEWIPTLAVFYRAIKGDRAGGIDFSAMAHSEDQLTIMALAIPFNEDSEKRPFMEKVGAGFYDAKSVPTCVVLSSEAWRSASPVVADGLWQPRDDPERKEVITIFGMAMGRKVAIAGAEITRTNGMISIGTDTVEAEH